MTRINVVDNFINIFQATRGKYDYFSHCLTPGIYNSCERLFHYFYLKGYEKAKEDILMELEEAKANANDSVPKSMYNSDKYKYAIKLIKEVK